MLPENPYKNNKVCPDYFVWEECSRDWAKYILNFLNETDMYDNHVDDWIGYDGYILQKSDYEAIKKLAGVK